MSAWHYLRSLWRNVVHRERIDRDLDQEIRTAFEMLVDEKVRAGAGADRARREAAIELGRVDGIAQRVRDARAGAFLSGMAQDVRYAARLLRRTPAFTMFAVLSLALGVGATTAIFSLFDNVVLKPLPVEEPDRLVVGSFSLPSRGFNYSLPYPQFEQIRQHSRTLESVFAMNPAGRLTVAHGTDSQIAEGMYVTGAYYRTLRLAPAAGRLLTDADDGSGQAVAVLSHSYWQRRFGGRVDIAGAPIMLNRVPFTVIGVEPEGFNGTEVGRPYDVSVPLGSYPLLNDGRKRTRSSSARASPARRAPTKSAWRRPRSSGSSPAAPAR
jgi:hypothetical protein